MINASNLKPGDSVLILPQGTDQEAGALPIKAEFLGYYDDEHEDTLAVVRLEGWGVYLSVFHCSRITRSRGPTPA